MNESALEAEGGPSPIAREMRGPQALCGIALLGLTLLIGVGSVGTWYGRTIRNDFSVHFSGSGDSGGLAGWRGPGWMTIALALATAIVVSRALVAARGGAPAIATTLMCALVIVTTYLAVSIAFWYPHGTYVSYFVGWGLWLCLASSALGVVVGAEWLRLTKR